MLFWSYVSSHPVCTLQSLQNIFVKALSLTYCIKISELGIQLILRLTQA